MDSARWQRIVSAFEAVEGLVGPERSRALATACGEDLALRHEVEALLAGHDVSQRYFARLALKSGITMAGAEELLHGAGRRIGAYRLLEPIGRGGMGVVYLAERADAEFDKRVAIKMLPLGLVSPESVARFRRERQIVAALEHTNIARLLDGGVSEEGTPYFVMEYVEGVPLDRFVDRAGPDVDAVLALFDRVCEAVSYAHRNLVIHRDLKPGNILVQPDGSPKLLDFGVATLLDGEDEEGQTITRLDMRQVTPAYAAPEVLQGESVSTACDVYSLGVILYRLLAGRPPFDGIPPSSPEWTTAVRDRIPAPPSQITRLGSARVRALRGDLDNIVAKCLRKEPERRYRSVESLQADLARHRARLPVGARPDSRRYRTGRFLRRHWIALGLSAGFVLLLLAGMASTFHYAMEARLEAREAERQSVRAEAVSDFLTDVFSAADPLVHLGREPTASQLLDMGVRELDRDPGLDSATRARLTQLMGRLYSNLAQYEDAGRLLADALEQVRGLYPDNHPEVGSVLLDMADREYRAGALATALDHARQAHEIFLGHHGEQHPRTADALYTLGYVQQESGHYREAVATLERVLAIRRVIDGEGHQSVARALGRLGYVYERQGEFADAEAHYRQALEIARRTLPPEDPFTASLLNDLGRLFAYLYRYPEALDHHRAALGMREAVYGMEHPESAISLHNIGHALQGLGRQEEAAEYLDRALSIYRSALGDSHWLTARGEIVLAHVFADMGRYAEAEQLLDHAERATRDAYGDSHRGVVMGLLARGYLRLREARYAEAEALFRRARALIHECCATHDRLVVRVNARLAASLAGQGHHEDARRLFHRYCGGESPIPGLEATSRMPPCDFTRLVAKVSVPDREAGDHAAPGEPRLPAR